MLTLTSLQTRIIGVMLEKETTTPEQYPLSVNALTNGCNQKSNREPVMSLSETEVQNGVDELVEMKQLMLDTGTSGRVNKYKHRFCNTTFGNLQLSDREKAILCVLFLRGPQTPGELRTRTQRLAEFENVSEVEATLEQLQGLDGQPKVQKLAREAGKRESRYQHLFSDQPQTVIENTHQQSAQQGHGLLSEDMATSEDLEMRVQILEQQLATLKAQFAELSNLLANNSNSET